MKNYEYSYVNGAHLLAVYFYSAYKHTPYLQDLLRATFHTIHASNFGATLNSHWEKIPHTCGIFSYLIDSNYYTYFY